MPRFESSGCSPNRALGEKNANCFAVSKWQIPLPLVAPSPFEGVRLAAGGAKRPPQQVQGRSPWRAFGDFPRDGKVTRGAGRSARISWAAGAPVPAKTSEGKAVPPLPIPRNEQKVASQRATIKQKNLPSAGKNLRCAVAETRIGRAIMAQQKSEGIFPRFFAAYSKFSGAFDIPSRSRAPCCGCAWRSRLRRFPAG